MVRARPGRKHRGRRQRQLDFPELSRRYPGRVRFAGFAAVRRLQVQGVECAGAACSLFFSSTVGCGSCSATGSIAIAARGRGRSRGGVGNGNDAGNRGGSGRGSSGRDTSCIAAVESPSPRTEIGSFAAAWARCGGATGSGGTLCGCAGLSRPAHFGDGAGRCRWVGKRRRAVWGIRIRGVVPAREDHEQAPVRLGHVVYPGPVWR